MHSNLAQHSSALLLPTLAAIFLASFLPSLSTKCPQCFLKRELADNFHITLFLPSSTNFSKQKLLPEKRNSSNSSFAMKKKEEERKRKEKWSHVPPNPCARAVIQFQRLLLSPDRPRRGRKRPRVWHTRDLHVSLRPASGGQRLHKTTRMCRRTHHREPLVAFVRGRVASGLCRMFWRGSWRNCALGKTRRKESLVFPLFPLSLFSFHLFPILPLPASLFIRSVREQALEVAALRVTHGYMLMLGHDE